VGLQERQSLVQVDPSVSHPRKHGQYVHKVFRQGNVITDCRVDHEDTRATRSVKGQSTVCAEAPLQESGY